MTTKLLMLGMLVGLVAGILAFGFARIFGEPQVSRAIAFEQQMARARGEAPEPELVSRRTQSGIGLFTGVVVYDAAMGGLFSLVFACVYGRANALSPRAVAALLALAGFLIVVVVPQLKYPADPPAIGDPATIGRRTALYFTMIATSLAACVLAIGLVRRLSPRIGTPNAVVIAGVTLVAGIAAVGYALPSVNEVPDQFSAVLLWRFRLSSLAVQAVLWVTLGLGFGIAAERSLGWDGRRRRPHKRLALR